MNIAHVKGINLGSGLIGIGRKWGHKESPIPEEQDVLSFLSTAHELNIYYFDTAASYGSSEERLGKFLKTLSSENRAKLIIATKFGDHWDNDKQDAYVDHSYKALTESLDKSLNLLGHIDLLYLHKAHIQALQNSEVAQAFEYAKSKGITTFGASVSDLESAQFVLKNDFYSVMQFPYNMANPLFSEVIDEATKQGKIVVINRPFNMGGMLYEGKKQLSPHEEKIKAFRFIMEKSFNGFILTGTKSPHHLQENYEAFLEAKSSI